MDKAAHLGRRTFTLRDLFGLMFIVCVGLTLLMMLLRGVQSAREQARKTQCSNQIKNLVLCMHNYEATQGRLPGKNAATVARTSMLIDCLPFIESSPFYSRLSLDIPPVGPSILGAPSASQGPTLAWQLNPAVPQCGPGGSHRNALVTNVPTLNCPSDLGITFGGLSYVPVVSTSRPGWMNQGARTSARALAAIWPASSEGTTGTILSPGTLPPYASLMNPPTVDGITDGSSNTLALAERVKGVVAGGRRGPLNSTWSGAKGSGFVVGDDGLIADGQDNAVQVDRCRQSFVSGAPPVTGPGNNDLSGSQFFQYTCVWMGCANTLGPPNSPVCSAGGPEAIAETGIAPPSSYHGPGANCGFMDGTVRFVSERIDLRVFHALGTIDGAEKHEWFDP